MFKNKMALYRGNSRIVLILDHDLVYYAASRRIGRGFVRHFELWCSSHMYE